MGAIVGASQLGGDHDGHKLVPTRTSYRDWDLRHSSLPRSVVLLPQVEEVDAIPTLTPTPIPVLRAPPVQAPPVEETIASYPWPYATTLRIAKCENAYYAYGYWRPEAIGEYGERGIMQIHKVHIDRIHSLGHTWDDMLKVEPNIAVAYDLWAEQGWGPWTCYWR